MLGIFAYYILATMLPIDTIIGRFYPLLALALLVMVVGLAAAVISGRLDVPDFSLGNLHPAGVISWPTIFITVSCGAVSGFHATQSPLMARCLPNERFMKPVFYGAMVAEGFIALVWASAAQGFYGSTANLQAVLANGGPGRVVHEICTSILGPAGGALAVLGVIVLPITSGDTAFRVSRLIVADAIGLSQTRIRNRFAIAVPLFALSLALNFVDFTLIWRYFGWANQTLAAVALWTGAVFLARRGSKWWIAAAPAVFMTIVTTTYIFVEQRGLGLPYGLGVGLGLASGVAAAAAFLILKPAAAADDHDDDLPPDRHKVEEAGDCLAC
jgi:carbon starvation protein CstA